MNILAVNASGRSGGSTAVLLNSILTGAAEAGHNTQLLELAGKTITPCTACRACKDSLKCAVRDDMDMFYEKAADTDVLVLGSPIYLGHITGNMMSFLHRLYSYLDSTITGHWPNAQAKLITAITYGAPSDELYDQPLEYMSYVMQRYFSLETIKSFKCPNMTKNPLTADSPAAQQAKQFAATL